MTTERNKLLDNSDTGSILPPTVAKDAGSANEKQHPITQPNSEPGSNDAELARPPDKQPKKDNNYANNGYKQASASEHNSNPLIGITSEQPSVNSLLLDKDSSENG